MAYFKDAWWNDLNELRSRTDKVYEKVGRNIWQLTAEKMIELRGWKVKEERLIPILEELGVYYIPKKLIPGPMFVFPEYDAAGKLTRAQTKPLHDLFGEGKYHTLGVKKELFLGPVWLGNSDLTLQKVLDTKSVLLVEGPFDLIATRMATDLPVMSSLTKSIGEKHEAYLKLLGVKQLYLMLDSDKAGENSSSYLARNLTIPTMSLVCPSADPSDAFKNIGRRDALIRYLKGME